MNRDTRLAVLMMETERGLGIVKPSTIRAWRFIAWTVLCLFAVLIALLPPLAHAQIPSDAAKYKRELTRQTRLAWGINAPIATFAAQIEQESGWRPDARSPVGALGLAQFMPSTGKWLSGLYADLSENEPKNPAWAMRALATYDKYLWDRVSGATDCHRAAKMLSSYNGGSRWVADDEALALRYGLDPELWWDNVERVNSGRSAANWKENRGYPPAILFLREPRYVKAGWGVGLCYDEAK